jgi:hypothetical protein
LEELGVDGRLIFEQILRETDWKGVDWIPLTQDRGQLQAFEYGNDASGSIRGWNFLTS